MEPLGKSEFVRLCMEYQGKKRRRAIHDFEDFHIKQVMNSNKKRRASKYGKSTRASAMA